MLTFTGRGSPHSPSTCGRSTSSATTRRSARSGRDRQPLRGRPVVIDQHTVISANTTSTASPCATSRSQVRDNDTPGVYIVETDPKVGRDGPEDRRDGGDRLVGRRYHRLHRCRRRDPRQPAPRNSIAGKTVVLNVVLYANTEQAIYLKNLTSVTPASTSSPARSPSPRSIGSPRYGRHQRAGRQRRGRGPGRRHRVPMPVLGRPGVPHGDRDYAVPNLRSEPGRPRRRSDRRRHRRPVRATRPTATPSSSSVAQPTTTRSG